MRWRYGRTAQSDFKAYVHLHGVIMHDFMLLRFTVTNRAGEEGI